MASGRPLQSGLRELIRNWEEWQSGEVEDATSAELAVMACVMSDHSISQPAILSWKSSHSDEFANFGHQKFLHEPSLPFRKRTTVLHSFNLVENHIDTPIYRIIDEDGFPTWNSPFDEADRFLHKRLCLPCLPTPTQAPFRLLDLPPEIRTRIFEYVLLLPGSGVWYDFKTRYNSETQSMLTYANVQVATRDSDAAFFPGLWTSRKMFDSQETESWIRVNLVRHMALLRVSKLIYKEASPCYYSRNVFYLPDSSMESSGDSFCDHFTLDQLFLVRHIIWWWPTMIAPWTRFAPTLATLAQLQTLIIDTQSSPDGSVRALLSVNVAALEAIGGLSKLVLYGPITAHESYLRLKMDSLEA